jgi:RNA polymerase sigma factor (sigma-70 family)
MEVTLPADLHRAQPDARIAAAVARESGRLRNFIRGRVPDAGDAEDILQDVFFELTLAYRLPQPIEQVGAWLFRVARNRIIDRFRKAREQPLPGPQGDGDDDGERWLDDVLPAPDDGPEAAYARRSLLARISAALADLPADQREVFIAHELDGHSFDDIAARSGVARNTLLARKRHAVLGLRKRLQTTYDEYYG